MTVTSGFKKTVKTLGNHTALGIAFVVGGGASLVAPQVAQAQYTQPAGGIFNDDVYSDYMITMINLLDLIPANIQGANGMTLQDTVRTQSNALSQRVVAMKKHPKFAKSGNCPLDTPETRGMRQAVASFVNGVSGLQWWPQAARGRERSMNIILADLSGAPMQFPNCGVP